MEKLENKRKVYKVSLAKGILLLILVFIIAFPAGYWLGWFRQLAWTKDLVNSIHSVREDNTSYHFIYPLLLFDFGKARRFLNNDQLQSKLNSYIQSQYKLKNAQSISVTFRDLPDGDRAAVNETVPYHPGSMLKVLIMMAYFREAELDPGVLQKNLTYTKAIDQETNSIQFSLPTALAIGQSYPTQHLIETMIENSDNGAEQVLLDNVDVKVLDQAYVDLGVPSPDTVSGDYTISASQYAGFLRILYNSTYLSEIYSEQALSIMSKSNYKDGIVAGVPDGTVVSQKYGERVDVSGNNAQAVELHNCGIVYTSSHPYSLCIMTKGTDEGKLAGVIKDLSSIVYGYVSLHEGNK